MQINVESLRSKASTCRDLAAHALTDEARTILAGIALESEEHALALEAAPPKFSPPRAAFNWLRS